MPLKTSENINKRFVFDAIANVFDIAPHELSIEERWGWVFISYHQANREYNICRFSEDREGIFIYLDKHAFADAGLGKISKESGKVLADMIEERSGTSKKIHVYTELPEELEEFDKYIRKLDQPENKSVWKRVFRRKESEK